MIESGQRKFSKSGVSLKKKIPDMIYVRVYEDRMDLLRAVIPGASGSPYQDGLFSLIFIFHLITLRHHRQSTIILTGLN